jgi:hypothetical protein
LKSLSYRGCLLALFITPVLAFAWYLFALNNATDQANKFQRVPFRAGDAHGEVVLSRGQHTLWVEGPYVSVRRNSAAAYHQVLSPRVGRCDTTTPPHDTAIRPMASQVFNIGGREGRSLWTFRADDDGQYCISVEGTYNPDVNVIWPRNVAVGEGVGLRVPIRPWVAVTLGVGVACAAALGLRTHMNRRRLERDFVVRGPSRP